MPENLDFISRTLTQDFVIQGVKKAAERLKGEPQWEQAHRIETDLSATPQAIPVQELIKWRVEELPQFLSERDVVYEWSI